MARMTCSTLLLLCSIQCLSLVAVHSHLVPAMYVFGDSLADNGNNMFLPEATPNYKPYAVDFPNGTFGRFTNAYTLAEHLAFYLGLPLQPPILDPCSNVTNSTNGFNYASSSSGIFPDTHARVAKSNLYLGEQVQLFNKTAREFLPSRLRNEKAMKRHLRKSIFFIQTGSNDYAINYINSEENRLEYTPDQFANLLVSELARQVKLLYELGARRFVVAEIGPLGCLPIALKKVNVTTKCVEQFNDFVIPFNLKLAQNISEFKKTLSGSAFVTMKGDFLGQLVHNPERYGFKDATNTCCEVNTPFTIMCVPNVPPCEDRESYVFFDGAHTTDEANEVTAQACFKGDGACAPVNIRQFLKRNKYIERKRGRRENSISFSPTSAPAPAPAPEVEF